MAINLDHKGSGNVTLKSPDSANTVVLTLPDSDGANNQVLTTDGSGNLSFADISNPLELYAENYDGTSTKPSATGTNAVAIGRGTSSGTESVSLGDYRGIASGNRSLAVGNSLASSEGAVALSIGNNTAAYGAINLNSFAAGGTAKASGSQSISLGYQSIASNANTTAVGYRAEATGYGSQAFGGESVADKSYAFAFGYRSKSSIEGKATYASDRFSADGDAQTGTFVLRSDTTDATPEALTTRNSTPGTTNQIILPNNSAYAFHGTIVARQQAADGTDCAAWKVEGLIRREGSAGTTVLVNSVTTTIDNTPGWGMALSADTTNGGLKIEVTGAAATNIRWVATVHTSEVTY